MFNELIDKLYNGGKLSEKDYCLLIHNRNSVREYASKKALEIRKKYYGNDVYIRGLIEVSNICKNDCYYCGIRRSNQSVKRYRLNKEQILDCCKTGYELGFRTFVLQGGEDSYFSDLVLCDIIKSIKNNFSDCAITLSLGERSKNSYQLLKQAGADRYLLRHESINKMHYEKLHPPEMSFDNRIACLNELKDAGFQVGCGFMVESPFQTENDLAKEMVFLKNFQPAMVGIGPFVTHHQTPFNGYKSGSAELTLFMLSLIRLTLPKVLLPATTALSTIKDDGRILGMLAGANVVMPNLSPQEFRKNYELYDNKASFGEEAAQAVDLLKNTMNSIGFNVVCSRGDTKMLNYQTDIVKEK